MTAFEERQAARQQESVIREAIFSLRKARVRALNEQAFYGTIGMGLSLEVCESHCGQAVETCATDGRSLFANPTYFMGKSEKERFIIVLHEIGHVALGHNLRRGDRDPVLWNVACDHVVNLGLKAAGYVLKGWLCDEKYRGWSAERIYADLVKQPQDPVQPQPPEEGEEGDEPTDSRSEPTEDESTQEDSQQGESTQEDSQQGGHEGQVWDQKDKDGNELDEEGKDQARREHADDVWKAKEAAAGNGLEAGLDRQVSKILTPDTNWESLVADYWNSGGGDPVGSTWTRFDRRAAVCGIWEPERITGGIEWAVLGFDVSYSINQDETDAYVALINSLRETVQANRITVVPFNSYVNEDRIIEIEPNDEVPSKFRVGGGTRFSPVFNWVNRQDEVPDFVMMFTDMGSSDFPEEPEYPVLWASSVPVWPGINEAPFGEHIEVELS
jgi:predicted metal-dependent peptidase